MNEAVERDMAERFLNVRYGELVEDVALLGGGDWSRAYSCRLERRDLVARFGRYVEDFQADQKAMTLNRPGLPVPTVLEVGEMAPGLFYAISERHYGTFLEALDEAGWRNLLPNLLHSLDLLREIVPLGAGIEWIGDPGATPIGWQQWLVTSLEDHPGGRVSGWRARIAENSAIDEVFVAGERVLRTLVAFCPEIRHIVHRDLLNRNVLVSEDNNAPGGRQLEAIFDWGCTMAGDFLYEIAWLTFWAPWYPALGAIDIRRAVAEHYATIGLVVENFDQRLTCYELQIGLEHIAYATFTSRDEDRETITERTLRILLAVQNDG